MPEEQQPLARRLLALLGLVVHDERVGAHDQGVSLAAPVCDPAEQGHGRGGRRLRLCPVHADHVRLGQDAQPRPHERVVPDLPGDRDRLLRVLHGLVRAVLGEVRRGVDLALDELQRLRLGDHHQGAGFPAPVPGVPEERQRRAPRVDRRLVLAVGHVDLGRHLQGRPRPQAVAHLGEERPRLVRRGHCGLVAPAVGEQADCMQEGDCLALLVALGPVRVPLAARLQQGLLGLLLLQERVGQRLQGACSLLLVPQLPADLQRVSRGLQGFVELLPLEVEPGDAAQHGRLLLLLPQLPQQLERLLRRGQGLRRVVLREVRGEEGVQGGALALLVPRRPEPHDAVGRHLQRLAQVALRDEHGHERVHRVDLPAGTAPDLPDDLQGLLRILEGLVGGPGLEVPGRDALQLEDLGPPDAQLLEEPQGVLCGPEAALEVPGVDARGGDAVHRVRLPLPVLHRLEELERLLGELQGRDVVLVRVPRPLDPDVDQHEQRLRLHFPVPLLAEERQRLRREGEGLLALLVPAVVGVGLRERQ
mmetsp:Transcript_34917/g.98004  ORF Transcript_34917/g.98004 Transcript_34917/m.98004 type:complete len:533 (-) Transcript_34917:348-1946(-)